MKIIDLSQTLSNKMPVYPGDPEVEIKQIHSIKKQGWRLRSLKLGTHTGTHVDALAHMDQHGKTIDQIPIDRFFGKAYLVNPQDNFPLNSGLVFNNSILNIDDFDKIVSAKPTFVVIANNCEFSENLERKLLQSGIITITNLINCNLLPKRKAFMFYAVPLKIKSGDGSPARAFAIV